MRDNLNQTLKAKMREKDSNAVATLRLILAALKDRDIAARTKGQPDGISDAEILQMLQTMIKQRRDSIEMYEQGGRAELAAKEQTEIDVIETFLPQQMDEDETTLIIQNIIQENNYTSLKEMGALMKIIKEKYTGKIDMGLVGKIAKSLLGN